MVYGNINISVPVADLNKDEIRITSSFYFYQYSKGL
jgi:hypothetical protein